MLQFRSSGAVLFFCFFVFVFGMYHSLKTIGVSYVKLISKIVSHLQKLQRAVWAPKPGRGGPCAAFLPRGGCALRHGESSSSQSQVPGPLPSNKALGHDTSLESLFCVHSIPSRSLHPGYWFYLGQMNTTFSWLKMPVASFLQLRII